MIRTAVSSCLLCVLALVVAGVWLPASHADSDQLEPLVPFHEDAAVAEQAAADAFGGFLRADNKMIDVALERLSENTRVLRAEERVNYGTTVGYSRSFRTTLNLAREYAYGGELDKSYEQVMWMQKACVACHNVVRGRNLLSTPEP